MGWKADQDQEDDNRLPAHTKRVGYDADEGVYYYRDTKAGSTWVGEPGNRYGVLHQVSNATRSINNAINIRLRPAPQVRANSRPSALKKYTLSDLPRVGTAQEIEGHNKRYNTRDIYAPFQSLSRAVSHAASITYNTFQTSLRDTRQAIPRPRTVSEPAKSSRSYNNLNRRKTTSSRYAYDTDTDSDSGSESESEITDDEKNDKERHTKHNNCNEKRQPIYGPQLFYDEKYDCDKATSSFSELESEDEKEEKYARRRQQIQAERQRAQQISRRRSTKY